MKERLVIGGLVLLALTALKKPELFRTLARKLKLVLFDDDRPVIRVRTGSLDVECWHSEFSADSGEWDHVHKYGKTPGRPEIVAIAYGANGEMWPGIGKKVVVTYDTGSPGKSSVTFQARPSDYVRIKTVGNLKKQSDTLLQDGASNVTITSLEVDQKGPLFAVKDLLIFV